MTMRERIARAIMIGGQCGEVCYGERVFCDDPRYMVVPAGYVCACRRTAEAVLAAMREPTEAMLEAGCQIGPDTNMGPFDYDSALDVFKAMIDAAITEGKT